MTEAELIAQERDRQLREWDGGEDFGAKHDDEHDRAELLDAAVAYAVEYTQGAGPGMDAVNDWWPWARETFKPSGDPLRDLAKAGALIAAEIDRLQRQAERGDEGAS